MIREEAPEAQTQRVDLHTATDRQKVVRTNMKHLVDSVRSAISQQNWYAALSVALSLPDICAKLEDPMVTSPRKRYVGWFQKNLASCFQRKLDKTEGAEPHTFLTGEDCYALRCAYSHAGEFDISEQAVRKALESFVFLVVPPPSRVHMNRTNTRLQLQVDLFCEEICRAAEKWLDSVAADQGIKARIARLPRIEVWNPGMRC